MKKTPRFGALLEVERLKQHTLLWDEAHVKGNLIKHNIFGALLEVEMWKKCTQLWREDAELIRGPWKLILGSLNIYLVDNYEVNKSWYIMHLRYL